MHQELIEEYTVPADQAGKRLDQVAAQAFSEYSRSRIQSWIKEASITIDGRQCKSKDKVYEGDNITLRATIADYDDWLPQEIPLDVIFDDKHIIVLNKPAGLVVHPGAGVPDGTLLNGLLFHYPELAVLPRAGIVHRLDKETSGLMVVARSPLAHTQLIQQLQDRSLGREYEALVMGELTGGGVVNAPIGRHPTQRTKMAVVRAESSNAKEAITHYRLLQRYKGYTYIRCQLETGRTHQIRVHLAHIKHPLVGDPVYLSRQTWVAGSSDTLKEGLKSFKRQALHAKKLSLIHPENEELYSWEVDLPEDMQQLLSIVAKEAAL